MEKKERISVEVDGVLQERDVHYKAKRGSEEIAYPKLKPFEHLFETNDYIKVFTSTVR